MIYSPRLILRAPTDEDAVAITKAKQEVWPELQMWMSWSDKGQDSLESTKQYISYTKQQAKKGGYPLIGVCRDTGEFVVATGLDLVEGKAHEYSTGYWVSKSFLGKGYATEACCAAIKYGFEALKANKIHIDYYADNMKSKRIIDKLGFDYTRTDVKAHRRFADGALVDVHLYEMTDNKSLPELEVSWNKQSIK